MYTFISGATGGLGKTYTDICAEKGYDLFLTARSADRLANLKKEITDKHPNITVEYFPCELTDDASRRALIKHIEEQGFKFDRIINVAGADKAFSGVHARKGGIPDTGKLRSDAFADAGAT